MNSHYIPTVRTESRDLEARRNTQNHNKFGGWRKIQHEANEGREEVYCGAKQSEAERTGNSDEWSERERLNGATECLPSLAEGEVKNSDGAENSDCEAGAVGKESESRR